MPYTRTVLRLLWMIPALIIVSILAFFLSRAIPGDPAEAFLEGRMADFQPTTHFSEQQKAYARTVRTLGLDKPLFYLGIRSHVLPDTLYRILRPEERSAARRLALNAGEWPLVQSYRQKVHATIRKLEAGVREYPDLPLRQWQNELSFLLVESDPEAASRRVSSILEDAGPGDSGFAVRQDFEVLKGLITQIRQSSGTYLWWPTFSWYGFDNQFHHWFAGILAGDLGTSARDARPVSEKIGASLQWTLWLNGCALFLAFLIAVPVGVWLARNRTRRRARWTRAVLFMMYAVPSFWLATIMVVFFTTPEYGQWLDWFPTQGLGNYRYADNWLERTGILAWHLTMPVFCLTVGSLAYIAQQMKQSLEHELKSDYYLFYRSFGLGEKQAVWHHAFRNALFPMITILGGAIPVLFSGSLIIEVIFNIPGMGRLMYGSILAKDWNVVFGVFLLISLITMVSYLLTDIGYQMVNPRVRTRQASNMGRL